MWAGIWATGTYVGAAALVESRSTELQALSRPHIGLGKRSYRAYRAWGKKLYQA